MMLYLAAKYQYRHVCQSLIAPLAKAGHLVIGHWITGDHDDLRNEYVRRRYAEEDCEDIQLADALVVLNLPVEHPEPSSGRMIEVGYALGLGKQIIVVGHAESVFFYLPCVERYATVEAFLHAFTAGVRATGASAPSAGAGGEGPTCSGLGETQH